MQKFAVTFKKDQLDKLIFTTDEFTVPEDGKINLWESKWQNTSDFNSIEVFHISEFGNGESIRMRNIKWKSGTSGKAGQSGFVINGVACNVSFYIAKSKHENSFIMNVSIRRIKRNVFKTKDLSNVNPDLEMAVQKQIDPDHIISVNQAA